MTEDSVLMLAGQVLLLFLVVVVGISKLVAHITSDWERPLSAFEVSGLLIPWPSALVVLSASAMGGLLLLGLAASSVMLVVNRRGGLEVSRPDGRRRPRSRRKVSKVPATLWIGSLLGLAVSPLFLAQKQSTPSAASAAGIYLILHLILLTYAFAVTRKLWAEEART
ncbi:MAG: hypothetical protein R3B72_49505 [Polyangiaceae bacterium]